jgi:enoyl-CoA hydratase/carnithine racemase
VHYHARVHDGITDWQNWLIHPSRLRSAWTDVSQPLAFIDLAICSDGIRLSSAPPFPIIGIGDAEHPLAPGLDAVIEAPVSAAALTRQILRAPQAATVAVQLLRSLQGMAFGPALTLESMAYGLLQGSAEHTAWLTARPAAPAHTPAGRLIVERGGEMLRLTLDRPAAHNAIDRELRDQLVEAFNLATLDRDLRQVRLDAIGPVFSIGGELAEFGTTRDPATAHLIRSRALPASAIASCPATFEAHVQGPCIGAGLEIAAFASRLTAGPDAWFQLPELAMGLIPGAGGCVSIPARIGRQRCALMVLSGRRVNAETALRWGLVDAIERRAVAAVAQG